MTLTRTGALALCGFLLALLVATPAAADQDTALPTGPNLLRLTVGSLAPKVVTSTSNRITVTGTVTNTGDRKVTDVEVRLQLSDPVGSSRQLSGVMADPPPTATYHSPFVQLARVLEPGQSAPVNLSVPVNAANPGTGLHIPAAGIYPLTVNVNGQPDYGGAARLASLNVLLPVRSVPGRKAAPEHRTAPPFGLTALWPIEETSPSEVGTTVSGRPILADDSLATELRPGGRLYELVTAGRDAVQDPQLGTAVCFAVDPELVGVANAMQHGYQVKEGNGTRPGSGAQAAHDWLADLTAATKGHCVVPIPYSDADLVALARAGIVDLEKQAVDPTALRSALPGAQLLDNVVWPADGLLDARTMGDLTDLKMNTALLAPSSLDDPVLGQLQSINTGNATGHALTVDPLLATGLRGEAKPSEHTGTLLTPSNTPAVASQNGIAGLVYLAQFATAEDHVPSQVIAAPPRRWTATAADLTAWADTLRSTFAEHAAYPVSLAGRVNSASVDTTSLSYSPSAAAAEIPVTVTNAVRKDNAKVRDLVGALHEDTATGVTPLDITVGLQQGLLRAVSGAWRRNDAAARTASEEATDRLRAFTGRISVGSSRLPINLASKDSQLPVSVSNALPANVRVRIYVTSTGLQTDNGAYTERWIPAHNSITIYLPVTVRRSGRFNVDITLTTPGQTVLGHQARLDVSSSAFGTVTLAITGGAFVMLILLSGRRVYRRVRAARQGGGEQ